MRIPVLPLAAAFVLSVLAAAGANGVPPAPEPSPAPPAASAAPAVSPAPDASAAPSAVPSAVPTPAVVHIKNFAYGPDPITIAAGQSVRFVEDDDAPHTVTATDRSFDSGNLDRGQSWTHTFAKPGTYPYFCVYHPMMKGRIIVK